MDKFKYMIFSILILVCVAKTTEALDVEYGTILGTSKNSLLVNYNSIGTKQNVLCSLSSYTCTPTKMHMLGKTIKPRVTKSIKTLLKKEHASHTTFSPSNKWIAYYIGATDTSHTRTYVLRNSKTKQESTITHTVNYWDLVDDQGKVFTFSPNEKTLVYLDDSSGSFGLYKVTLPKTIDTAIKLNTTAQQVDDFIFTDSSTLYYIGNTKDNPYDWMLYRYNLKTNTDEVVAHHVSYIDSIKYIGDTVLFSQLQEKGYGPVAYNLKDKKIHTFKIPSIETSTPTITDQILSTNDIHGVAMVNPNIDTTQSHPLIIWLHGGPYRQTSLMFHPFHSYGLYDSILQTLEKNNVLILKLDYPGSLGYGRQYAESLKESVGGIDVASVMNAISYMKSRYNVNNVYLAGNSYGGYLALKTVVEHPDIITGVVSINGVTDWESLLVRMQRSIFNIEFNGLPDTTNRNLYDTASILSRIHNLTNQKITIIQGQSDKTIPPWQAELLYSKLFEQNKNVSIVRYPNEDHVFKQKKTLMDLCGQMFTSIGLPIDQSCIQ